MKDFNFDELQLEYLSFESSLLLDKTDLIKNRILCLPEHEKRLILLYIELGSFRKVAKIFGCSHTKVIYIIRKIIDKVKKC